jgi:hypothetical protein
MRNILGVLISALVVVSPVLQIEAAELRAARPYYVGPKRSFLYPYGGSYLYGTYSARRQLGVPYVSPYYGNYYGPYYANLYDPYPFNYYDPFLNRPGVGGCVDHLRPCQRPAVINK